MTARDLVHRWRIHATADRGGYDCVYFVIFLAAVSDHQIPGQSGPHHTAELFKNVGDYDREFYRIIYDSFGMVGH
jgi:hypothetical protein